MGANRNKLKKKDQFCNFSHKLSSSTEMSKELFDTRIMPIHDKMYRYALSILKSPDNAHDVVQECLIKIWKKRQMISTIDNPESWAMRITRNQCYDWVKVNRYNLLQVEKSDQADISSADQELLFKDREVWLNKIIDNLPAKHREIFHLREIEELAYQEIADILSLTLGEVKISLFRTREKIKELINKLDTYGLAN